MCSIGWLKLEDSWILFKNRDRAVGEAKENVFIQDDDLVGFGDKKFPGLWIGINKYGVGITTAYGPIKDVPFGLTPENFEANEEVLRKCKTVKEATGMYLELAKELGRSFNIIIADSKHAVALETIPNDSSKEDFDKIVAKTNYFTKLKKYNIDKERIKRSDARFKKLMEFLPRVKDGKDLIPILKFHSKTNDYENICRHDYTETVASAIFEVRGGKIKIYYSLNKFAHDGNFEGKTISLGVKHSKEVAR